MAFKFVPCAWVSMKRERARFPRCCKYSEAVGVTLAIVRKGRDLFWAGVGMALLVHRSWSLRATREQRMDSAGDTNLKTFNASEFN